MKETVVIDDVVSKELQTKLYEIVMGGQWRFVNDMSYNNSSNPSYGFNQTFKHPKYGIMSSLYEQVCVPIVNSATEKLNLSINDIYFTRSFLQLPLQDKYIKVNNGIHVDLPIDHYACVYYCNDSDGDTIIYEQNTDTTPLGSNNIELIEHKRVSPKIGRMVLFDGKRYHCSSQPRDNLRCIINFNLV